MNMPENPEVVAAITTGQNDVKEAIVDVLQGGDVLAAIAKADKATARVAAAETTAVDCLPSDLVRAATEAAVARMPKGSKTKVDGSVLKVAAGEGPAVVAAISEHMRAIVKENRSANMYREGKLRKVRSAVIAAVPGSDAGVARPIPPTGPSTGSPSPKNKAAERIETLAAHKDLAKAAKESGAPIPSDVLAKTDAAKARKMAEARRTRTAPAAVAS